MNVTVYVLSAIMSANDFSSSVSTTSVQRLEPLGLYLTVAECEKARADTVVSGPGIVLLDCEEMHGDVEP